MDISPVIVVPDGLAYDPVLRVVLPRPSFVFRSVIDFVRRELPGRVVYLAPANTFGAGLHEQDVAQAALSGHDGRVVCVPSVGACYIDTRGNADQLRSYLARNGQWPLPPVVLVAAELHAARARLCFIKAGFELSAVVGVAYRIPHGEAVVPRLFYYRFRFLHRLYEAVAWLRDFLRPSSKR
jgi:uncharacterized SAM-binding protein YcdF (DUF218 family)